MKNAYFDKFHFVQIYQLWQILQKYSKYYSYETLWFLLSKNIKNSPHHGRLLGGLKFQLKFTILVNFLKNHVGNIP